jgi:hypothetical protein
MDEKSGADSRYLIVKDEAQLPVSNDRAEEVKDAVPLQTSLFDHCFEMYLGGVESSRSYLCDPIPAI